MQGLSTRQRAILKYIHERFQDEGILPSYREIGDAMGIRSTNGVSDHVRALERKGYLARVGRSGKGALARAMALTDKAMAEFSEIWEESVAPIMEGLVEIPVFGRVNAGSPPSPSSTAKRPCTSTAAWSPAEARCSPFA